MYKTENAIVTGVDFNIDPVYNQFRIALHVKAENGLSWSLFNSYNVGDAGNPQFNLIIDSISSITPRKVGNYLAYFFAKIFEVVEVTDINQIKDKPIRIVYEIVDDKPVAIGIQHFLDTAKFFIPSLTFKETVDEELQSILKQEIYDEYLNHPTFYNQLQSINKKDS